MFGNNFFMQKEFVISKITRVRFAIFCLVIFCVVCLPIRGKALKYNFEEKTTYFFYTTKFISDINNAKVVSNGNCSIVVCDDCYSDDVKQQLPCVFGESMRIKDYSQKTLSDIKNRYSQAVMKTEVLQNYEFMYCYDATLPKYVIVDGEKVNLQIAISKTEINIGYPLILNGY